MTITKEESTLFYMHIHIQASFLLIKPKSYNEDVQNDLTPT